MPDRSLDSLFSFSFALVVVLGLAGLSESAGQTKVVEIAQLDTSDQQRLLWNKHVNEARSEWQSGRVGRRFTTLEIIKKAAAIRPSIELRNAAIAAMASTDLRLVRHEVSPPSGEDASAVFNADLRQYARSNSKGQITVHKTSDGSVVQRLASFPRAGDASSGAPLAVTQLHGFGANRHLAAGYDDGNIRVWNLESGSVRLTAKGDKAVFDSTGTYLAVSKEGSVTILQISSPEQKREIPTSAPTTALAFKPGTVELAVGSDEGVVTVVDGKTGEVRWELEHRAGVSQLAWSVDGLLMAAALENGQIYIWNSASREMNAILRAPPEQARRMAFVPGGSGGSLLLTSRLEGGPTTIWDSLSGGRLSTIGQINGVFQAGAATNRVGFWQKESGAFSLYEIVVPEFIRAFDLGGEHAFGGSDKFFSPDGSLLLMGSGNRVAWFLNTRTGKKLGRIEGPRDFYCYLDSTGKWFATESGAGVHIWPVTMNAAERTLVIGSPRKIGETDVADWVRFSADSSTIIYVEEKIMGRAVRVPDLSDKARPFKLNSFPDNLALSRKGDSIAVSNGRTGFSLYHLIGDEFERALFGEEGNTFKTFAFLPNDREILLNDPAEISIWDMDKSKKIASLAKERAEFPGKVSIGERANFAAIQTRSSGTRVLSVPALEVLFEHVHQFGSGDPKLSPCGRYLALHWGNGRVELWNLQLMRQKLDEMGLDWKEPGFGKVEPTYEVELEKVVVSGELLPE